MSQGSKTPKHILHFISKELQVQHTWFCRGAPQAAGEEMGSCLCCSSFHWGETSPIHLLNLCTLQAFLVAGGSGFRFGNFLSSVLTLLPGAAAWTPLADLPRAMSGARASIVGDRLRVTGGLQEGSGIRSEVTN